MIPDNIAQQVNQYDVVVNYRASGSAVQTTGSITSGSSSLTVASNTSFEIGYGIFVLGAGASGANLISTITDIQGTTITLAATAGTTVSSVRVQHDDTAAINNALADAYNAFGGRVWLAKTGCDGLYRCNGPFNATTFGVLTFPQNLTYNGLPRRVELVAEVRGNGNGVMLDFTDTATPTGGQVGNAAAIAGAPYVKTTGANYTSVFQDLEFCFDNIILNCPRHSQIHGIQMSNALRCTIGDCVTINSSPTDGVGAPLAPTVGIIGLWLPQWLNNVMLNVGSCQINGFGIGIRLGEHARLNRPYITYCNVGLYASEAHDSIYGSVCIETCVSFMQVDTTAVFCPVNLLFDNEVTDIGSNWWNRGTYDIIDTANLMTGVIQYKIKNTVDVFLPIILNGATNTRFINTQLAPATQKQVLGSAASTITFALPAGYTNAHITIDTRSTIAANTDYVLLTLNGDGGANYNCQQLTANANGSTVTQGDYLSIVHAYTPVIGATAAANYSSIVEIDLINYANTSWYKNGLMRSTYFYPTGLTPASYDQLTEVQFSWMNTAAVTSVTLSLANFGAGTIATLTLS